MKNHRGFPIRRFADFGVCNARNGMKDAKDIGALRPRFLALIGQVS